MNTSITEILQNRTSKMSNYDSFGAARYLIVVISTYFLGIGFYIAWQIKRRIDSSDHKAQLLLGMEDQIKTMQLLG